MTPRLVQTSFVCVVLGPAAFTRPAAQAAPPSYIAASRDHRYQRHVSWDALSLVQLMEQFYVPGVSVAVIHDCQVHWADGYGIADVVAGA